MTNITQLSFDDGAQINVDVISPAGEIVTYACHDIDLNSAAGVGLTFTHPENQRAYKAFVPFARIVQIWQEV